MAPWYPADLKTRGLANQWMDWCLTRMHQPMTFIFKSLIRTAPEDCDPDAMDKVTKQAAEYWALVDQRLKNTPFITGDEPSMADFPLACYVNRWYTLEVERPALPRLEAYYQRLQERPHYREHVMVKME